MADELWLTKEAAAEYSGFSERKIRELGSGDPPKIAKRHEPAGPGKRWKTALYSRDSLQAYMDGENEAPGVLPIGLGGRTPDLATVLPILDQVIGTRYTPVTPPVTVWGELVKTLAAIAASVRPAEPLGPPLQPTAFISMNAAAKYLNMPVKWVYVAILEGRLRAERTSATRWKVRPCDLDALQTRTALEQVAQKQQNVALTFNSGDTANKETTPVGNNQEEGDNQEKGSPSQTRRRARRQKARRGARQGGR